MGCAAENQKGLELSASSGQRPKTQENFIGKGIAIAVKEAHHGEANAEVGLDDARAIYVVTTVPDTGTGAHTIFRQIAGEALELSADDITVVMGNTDTFPTTSQSAGAA